MKEKISVILLIILCSSISYYAGYKGCRNEEYAFMYNLAMDKEGTLSWKKNFMDSMDKYFDKENLNASELHMKWVWKMYSRNIKSKEIPH